MSSNIIHVSKELSEKMKTHPEVSWDKIAEDAIMNYLIKIEQVDKAASESELTEEDVEEIGDLIKESAWKRYQKEKHR